MLFLSLLLFSFVFSSRFFVEHSLEELKLESNSHIPSGWSRGIKASPTHPLKFHFGIVLSQKQQDSLDLIFSESNAPYHERSRNHASLEEIADVLKNQESIDKIIHHISPFGKTSIHPLGHYVTLETTAEQAEKLFQVEFYHFINKEYHADIIRASSRFYSLDSQLHNIVEIVSGIHRFPSMKSLQVNTRNGFRVTGQESLVSSLPDNNIQLLSPRPGVDQISLVVIPRCKTGSLTFTAASPCSESTAIKSFDYILTPTDYGESGNFGSSVTETTTITSPTSGFKHGDTSTQCWDYDSVPNPFKGTCEMAFNQYNVPVSSNPVCCVKQLTRLSSLSYQRISVQVQATYADDTTSLLQNPFGAPHSASVNLTDFVTLVQWTRPDSIYRLYQIPTGLKATKARQAVTEFLGQYYSQTDLDKFLDLFGIPRQPHPIVKGPNIYTWVGVEAQLDISWIILNQAKTEFWSYAGLVNNNEPFMDWQLELVGTKDPPGVFSTSYADPVSDLTKTYMDNLNTNFKIAGSRGVSLLFSSGDDGSLGYNARNNPNICTSNPKFDPEFPSCSPYITSVGATNYAVATTQMDYQVNEYGLRFGNADIRPSFAQVSGGIGDGGVEEVACSTDNGARITVGSGFSWNYPRNTTSKWQDDFVSEYLEAKDIEFPLESMWNRWGRAYPDVAVLGHNFLTVVNQSVMPVDGTSASSPTFALIVTLLNDQLLNIDKPRLGFLNPTLYDAKRKDSTTFSNIRVGKTGCTAIVCCENIPGFSASSTPWDAASGLGSPSFSRLSQYLVPLEQVDPNNSAAEPKKSTNDDDTPSLGLTLGLFFLVIGLIAILGFYIYKNRPDSDYRPISGPD